MKNYNTVHFRFQKKGMDIGVTDESLNGVEYEESSSSEEEEIGIFQKQ